MSSNRTMALGAVAIIHVLLGYALLNGLASKALKLVTEPLKTVNIKEEVKPPETPPPPPKDIEIPPFVPPPEVQIENTTQVVAPVRQTVVETPRPSPVPVAPTPAPVAAPAPPAGPTSRAVGNPRGFEVSDDDYPPQSLRAEEEGVTRVSVQIGVSGRVEACSVVTSSGFPRLDERTCKIAQSRWRYKPALQEGKPVASTEQKSIRWQINKK